MRPRHFLKIAPKTVQAEGWSIFGLVVIVLAILAWYWLAG